MNAIIKALSDIRFRIPPEILNIAFITNNDYRNVITSLDDRIKSSVITARVLVDANLVGGVSLRVPLSKCNVTYSDGIRMVINVPKNLTDNRSIISALTIVDGSPLTGAKQESFQTSPALDMAGRMMSSLDMVPVVQTSRIELIGDNTILINDYIPNYGSAVLNVNVENDVNLSNINPRNFPAFSQLCVLATQAHIYNTKLIDMGKGYIYGGYELGAVQSYIETFADADEQYREYLVTTWAKVAFINDEVKMTGHIQSMFGNTF